METLHCRLLFVTNLKGRLDRHCLLGRKRKSIAKMLTLKLSSWKQSDSVGSACWLDNLSMTIQMQIQNEKPLFRLSPRVSGDLTMFGTSGHAEIRPEILRTSSSFGFRISEWLSKICSANIWLSFCRKSLSIDCQNYWADWARRMGILNLSFSIEQSAELQ